MSWCKINIVRKIFAIASLFCQQITLVQLHKYKHYFIIIKFRFCFLYLMAKICLNLISMQNVNKLLGVSYTNCLFPEHYMSIFLFLSTSFCYWRYQKIDFSSLLFIQPNKSSLFKQRKCSKIMVSWFSSFFKKYYCKLFDFTLIGWKYRK